MKRLEESTFFSGKIRKGPGNNRDGLVAEGVNVYDSLSSRASYSLVIRGQKTVAQSLLKRFDLVSKLGQRKDREFESGFQLAKIQCVDNRALVRCLTK